jgi:uncharacterized protein (TIGR00369 family)
VPADRLSDLVDHFNGLAVGRALGVRCERLAPAESHGAMTADPNLLNPNGAVPGTALAAFADMLGGMAVATVAEGDEGFATLELSVTFMRPAFGRVIHGTSTVLRRGAGHAFVRVDIHDEERRLCVAGNGTWAIFPAQRGSSDGDGTGP